MSQKQLLTRIRAILTLFIFGLVISGVTAFPLLHELELLARWLGIAPDGVPSAYSGLQFWICTVRQALRETYAAYPLLAYGTDWLAFGHLVIALFFISPFLDPSRYSANIKVGVAACILVLPLALICGPIRGIPFYWRLVDCAFGVFGSIPLLYVLHLTNRLEASRHEPPHVEHTASASRS